MLAALATQPTARPGRRRPRSPASTRPASTAPARSRRQRRPRHRPHPPTASIPGAPLAAVAQHGAGRVVVLADSDLFGDDCIGELDHERALAQPRLLGRAARLRARAAAAPRSPAAADPALGPRSSDAVEELRLTQEPDGSVDTAEHDPARLRELVDDDRRRPRRRSPPLPPPGTTTSTRSRADLAAWADAGFAQARLRPLDRGLPPRARPPRRDRAPRASSRCTSRTPPRDTCFEALIVRVPWPEWIDELERDPLRQRQVPAGHLRRLHRGLRLRVRGPLPGDLLDRRAPVRVPLRRDLLRPRGRALPPRLRRRRRDPAPQPAARRRLPAVLARALRVAPTCSGT